MRTLTLSLALASGVTVVDAAPATSGIEVQGHRGARAVRPENSLPAFEYALDVGVDVLELDLVVTKDDRLVVTHDPYVSETLCQGPRGRPVPPRLAVRSLTLDALEKFDCGSKANPRFPSQVRVPGTPIPTLDEVFTLVAARGPGARRVQFNIETKIEPARPDLYPTPERFVELLVEVVRAHRMSKRTVIQSFDARTLLAVRRRAPKLRTSMLISDNAPPLVPIARALGAAIISPHHEWITAEEVEALHTAGIRVVPWNANTEAAFSRLIELGVDGIITDDPARLIGYLKKRKLR